MVATFEIICCGDKLAPADADAMANDLAASVDIFKALANLMVVITSISCAVRLFLSIPADTFKNSADLTVLLNISNVCV